jgi:hypothetical protein
MAHGRVHRGSEIGIIPVSETLTPDTFTQPEELDMADLPVAVFEIKEYMIIFRQLEERDIGGVKARIRGIVRCSGADPKTQAQYRLDVYFLTSDSPTPAPQIDLANNNGAIFFPFSDMQVLVDVLRNEKPIYGHLRADKPEWTSITTTNEPVGSGETD